MVAFSSEVRGDGCFCIGICFGKLASWVCSTELKELGLVQMQPSRIAGWTVTGIWNLKLDLRIGNAGISTVT